MQIFFIDLACNAIDRYKQEFGFVIPGRPILVDDIRVRGVGKGRADLEQSLPRASGLPPADMVT
jgi:5-oxoprolinase (ATP-hydrolysing)